MEKLKKSKWNDLFFDMIEKFPELRENYSEDDLISYRRNGEIEGVYPHGHVYDVIEHNFQKGNKDFLKRIFAYIEELLAKDEDFVRPIRIEILERFYGNGRVRGIENYFGEQTTKEFNNICKDYEQIKKACDKFLVPLCKKFPNIKQKIAEEGDFFKNSLPLICSFVVANYLIDLYSSDVKEELDKLIQYIGDFLENAYKEGDTEADDLIYLYILENIIDERDLIKYIKSHCNGVLLKDVEQLEKSMGFTE